MFWKKKREQEIVQAIIKALNDNNKYSKRSDHLMGFPGSYLDTKIFSDLPKLTKNVKPLDAYLHVLKENPNHIGCPTLGETTAEFYGTQRIERELLTICAEKILGAKKNKWDGYVSSGGTESNIEAMWIFRNIWLDKNLKKTKESSDNEIEYHAGQLHIIASKDAHYSIEKGANLLGIACTRISIDEKNNRQINLKNLKKILNNNKAQGVKKFLLVLNMGSTNFGSVDDVDRVSELLEKENVDFEIHVDAAFGGFIYPFTNPNNKLTFSHPKIMSFTLDAHKMLQSPYGTGIFITRKGRIKKVKTAAATYIPGDDVTLVGSRSGANTVFSWMILQAYGSEGGKDFCKGLIQNTDYLCSELKKLNIQHYRNEFMNVVAINADSISKSVADVFHLVEDSHTKPKWRRVVVMEHANMEMIDQLLKAIKQSKKISKL